MLQLNDNYIHRFNQVKNVYCITKPSKIYTPSRKCYFTVPFTGLYGTKNVLLGFKDIEKCSHFTKNKFGNKHIIEKYDAAEFEELGFKLNISSIVILNYQFDEKLFEIHYCDIQKINDKNNFSFNRIKGRLPREKR